METSKTVTLRKPVSLGPVQYTELPLEEPTAKQLIAARKAGIPEEQIAALISLSAKVPPAVVDQLCQRDFEECADFLVRFGGDAWKTPGLSSPASPSSTAGAQATLSA